MQNGARFEDQRRSSNQEENNDGCRRHHRRHGVHGDAQRTMVGVRHQGVNVRDLDYRDQREQGEADHRRHREPSRRGAPGFSPVWPCQQHFSLTARDKT